MLEISKRLIDISEMTRPKEKIKNIFKIVLHHAPIKGATAISNRNYMIFFVHIIISLILMEK